MWPIPFQEQLVICRLQLAMITIHPAYQIWSLYTHPVRRYKRQCKKLKLGWFGELRVIQVICNVTTRYSAYNFLFDQSTWSMHFHTQLCNKVRISYNWLPHIYPTHHPKWHPDPVCRFATIHPPERQTDTWAQRQVCTNSRLCLIVSDAANNNNR